MNGWVNITITPYRYAGDRFMVSVQSADMANSTSIAGLDAADCQRVVQGASIALGCLGIMHQVIGEMPVSEENSGDVA